MTDARRPPIDAAPLFAELDAHLIALLESLEPADWRRGTIAGAWTVHDVACHLLDTATRRLSMARDGWFPPGPPPATDAELAALIERMNQDGVRVLSRLSPPLLIALTRRVTRELHDYLQSIDPFAPAVFAVTWAGESASAHWFDVAREYTERWHHQQQIRLAVDRPGIMTRSLYFPVLDTFMHALPRAYASVEAPSGALAEVVVEGEAGGVWHLVREAQQWQLGRGAAPGPAVARTRIPQEIAWRLFTRGIRRHEAEPRLAIEGDRAVGGAVLDALAIVAPPDASAPAPG